jgi:hypothetical protein
MALQPFSWAKALLRVLAAILAAWMVFRIYAMSVANSYEAELYGAALAGTLIAIGINRSIHRRTVTWRSRTVTGIIGGAFAFYVRDSTSGMPDFSALYGNDAASFGRPIGAAVYWIIFIHACLISFHGPAVMNAGASDQGPKRSRLEAARCRVQAWHGGKLVLLWLVSGVIFVLLRATIDPHQRELPLVLLYWCILSAPLFWASWVWLHARQSER